eukprot:1493379-Rhodomonas_salina.1
MAGIMGCGVLRYTGMGCAIRRPALFEWDVSIGSAGVGRVCTRCGTEIGRVCTGCGVLSSRSVVPELAVALDLHAENLHEGARAR